MSKYSITATKKDYQFAFKTLMSLENQLGEKLDWKKIKRVKLDELVTIIEILKRKLPVKSANKNDEINAEELIDKDTRTADEVADAYGMSFQEKYGREGANHREQGFLAGVKYAKRIQSNTTIVEFCKNQISHFKKKGNKISDIQLGMIDAYTSILEKIK